MRLLLDESLSARLVAPLAEAGHDVVHLGDLDLLGASDDDVLAAATQHNRILITADTDFGALLAVSGASLPSVVLLRRGGRTPTERAQQINIVLEAAAEALQSGALVVAEPTRARIRPLPWAGVPNSCQLRRPARLARSVGAFPCSRDRWLRAARVRLFGPRAALGTRLGGAGRS